MKELGIIIETQIDNKPFYVFGQPAHARSWARQCEKEIYEIHVLPLFTELEYDWFIDVGAGFGFHSLMNLRLGKKVIAFEAHPIRKGFVEYNLASYPDAQVFGALSSNRTAPAVGMVNASRGDALNHDIFKEDDLLENLIDESILIKIDVEGSELEVLAYLSAFLSQPKVKWIVEVHEPHGVTLDDVKEYFPHHTMRELTDMSLNNYKVLFTL